MKEVNRNDYLIWGRFPQGLFLGCLVLLVGSCELPSVGEGVAGHGAKGKVGRTQSFVAGPSCSEEILNRQFISDENFIWKQSYNEKVCREIDHHSDLLTGLPDKPNPMKGLCDNFLSLTMVQKKDAMATLIMAIANAEGKFKTGKKGNHGIGETKYTLAQGLLQLSPNLKDYPGCFVHGESPLDIDASIKCAFSIMSYKYQKYSLPIANNKKHGTVWSVLKPNMYLRPRLIEAFQNFAPQCRSSFVAKRDRNHMPPKLITPSYAGENLTSKNGGL